MAFSEQTTHYGLPHWLGDDKPTFLSDLNGAFEDIDTGIYGALQAGEQGQADAATVDGKVTTLTGRVETLESDDTSLTGRVGTLETTVSGQGGSINTINSLIGNGEPTTSDKTLIGAINELDAGKASTASVDAKVDKGNIIKFTGIKSFTVTGDGVKTVSELLNELHTAYTTYLAGKSAGYIHSLRRVYIQDSGAILAPADNSLSLSAIPCKFSNLVVSAYTLTTNYLEMYANGSIHNYATGTTVTPNSSTVYTDTKTIELSIYEYELV